MTPFPEDFRTEYFKNFPGPASRFDQSDMVVIGSVESVNVLGLPIKAAARSPIGMAIWIEPFRLRVRVENIFKGRPPSTNIEVDGYLYSQRNDRQLGQPLPFQPEPSQRRLLFLRVEGSRLRLLHDVFDYSLRISSGEHDRVDPKFALSPKMAASWILLTRGRGCASDGFALRLVNYTWFAEEFVGTSVMMSLLKDLVQDPSPEVRREAEELLRSFNVTIGEGREPFEGPHPSR